VKCYRTGSTRLRCWQRWRFPTVVSGPEKPHHVHQMIKLIVNVRK